ncbi:phage antirepressor N-terminal domain-containing protein [Coralloluteibacterium thermophilus]|uniref:Phage antirepressor N-terminal domain-containing protein n=1 Tax=Coralloluteibacterium thermophilum TaxID=2707049 RepID=A0ABV9NFV7_9GAMM
MSAAPVRVEFAGATLLGVVDRGVAWVAMRPIVEGMGLDWKSQHKKITDDEVLGATVVEKTMVAEDGKRRSMVCLPEEFLQGWLFKINPNKVSPVIREKVVRYQRECYRVLHQAFTGGVRDRVLAIDSKRAMARVVTDMLSEVMEEAGRVPKRHHFMNEHRLCNLALRGEFGAIDEKSLSAEDAWKLAEIRKKDAVLIVRFPDYKDRKPKLLDFAAGLTARLPRRLQNLEDAA